MPDDDGASASPRLLACQQCKKRFTRPENLARHMKTRESHRLHTKPSCLVISSVVILSQETPLWFVIPDLGILVTPIAFKLYSAIQLSLTRFVNKTTPLRSTVARRVQGNSPEVISVESTSFYTSDLGPRPKSQSYGTSQLQQMPPRCKSHRFSR